MFQAKPPFRRRAALHRCILALAALALPLAAGATTVATYHNDNQRTGWNPAETALTPATVASPSFGLLHQIRLDEQLDAAPLYTSGLAIAGGTHNVVYAATEANSVYAIDADTGVILAQTNLGPPVPMSALPGGCNNNSANIGINSTPVLDPASGRLYVMAHTYTNAQPQFVLHALNDATLADASTPVTVTATATLADGTTAYSFNPAVNRQRPALLLTGGTVYAGFGSFCDISANLSRGWVLGWNAATLAPLPANHLTNLTVTSANDRYLTSIWMSGYGLASDDEGSLFFATANSSASDYSTVAAINLAESVVRLSADLTTVQGWFTPANHAAMDRSDSDLGSGGVMVLPTQAGKYPNLAVAAGKTNSLYLLDRDRLGGTAAAPPAIGTYTDNGCWCGESYYVGSDGIGRVVSSTGNQVAVAKLVTTGGPRLVGESQSAQLPSGGDPGFFTAVSSNGQAANSAIVWAVPHPDNSDTQHKIALYAFDPANHAKALFHGFAGIWAFAKNANANLVPVVADGHVFVGTYAQLAIFGLSTPAAHAAFTAPPAPKPILFAGAKHDIYGTLIASTETTLTLRRRTGATLPVDIAKAQANGDVTDAAIGEPLLVRGDYDAAGHFVAAFVLHAKPSPLLWAPDR